MRCRLCNLTILGMLVTASTFADTMPFVGQWAAKPEACGKAGDIGNAITLSASRLAAPPLMTCEFTSLLDMGWSDGKLRTVPKLVDWR